METLLSIHFWHAVLASIGAGAAFTLLIYGAMIRIKISSSDTDAEAQGIEEEGERVLNYIIAIAIGAWALFILLLILQRLWQCVSAAF